MQKSGKEEIKEMLKAFDSKLGLVFLCSIPMSFCGLALSSILMQIPLSAKYENLSRAIFILVMGYSICLPAYVSLIKSPSIKTGKIMHGVMFLIAALIGFGYYIFRSIF